MSKREWRGACERSGRRLENLKIDDLSLGFPRRVGAEATVRVQARRGDSC
jgi:hypothetical protein